MNKFKVGDRVSAKWLGGDKGTVINVDSLNDSILVKMDDKVAYSETELFYSRSLLKLVPKLRLKGKE